MREFGVPHVAIFEEKAAAEARASGLFPAGVKILSGLDGLCELAVLPEAHLVVTAVVGTLGLKPTLAAIRAKKAVSVASKEILVLAGKFVMAEAAKHGVPILPMDSEHNAIFQCLHAEPKRFVDRLILTASGGRFRDSTLEEMRTVTPEQALKHPNWSMGPKITVDSSTMINKGLELIEARWLFDLPEDRIDIVVHPQSIIHSMVRFVDGPVLAHLSPPSMTFAIQHCLFHPERAEAVSPTLDFSKAFTLDIRPPDTTRFPGAASGARGVPRRRRRAGRLQRRQRGGRGRLPRGQDPLPRDPRTRGAHARRDTEPRTGHTRRGTRRRRRGACPRGGNLRRADRLQVRGARCLF